MHLLETKMLNLIGRRMKMKKHKYRQSE